MLTIPIFRTPWLPASLSVVLLVLMLAFTRTPVIETRIDDLDIEDNPYKLSGEKMAEFFGSKNLVQVVVRPSGTKMPEFAAALDSLKNNLEITFPGMRVETINRALPVISRYVGREPSVKQALTAALNIPVARNLVSRDTNSVLMVAFADGVESFDVQRFDSILAIPVEGISSLSPLSTGHIEHQTEKSIIDDYNVMIPLFLLLFTGLLYLSYHSLSAVFFCMINLLLSFIPVLFFFTLYQANINQVTMPAIPVVAILSLSASVHLLTGFRFRHDSGNLKERITSTIHHYRVPTFLSTLTTSVSFCSFYLSDSLYIRQFGLIAGCSIMAVFIITFLLAPFTLRLVREIPSGKKMPVFTQYIERFLFNYHKPFSVVLLLIAILSVFFVNRISFSTNIETYIPLRTPVYKSNQELRNGFHSLASLDVLIESSTEPESLSRGRVRRELVNIVSELAPLIDNYPGVVSIESVKDQLEFESRYALPGIRTAIFPRANNPYVSMDQFHYRINIRLSDPEHIPRVKEFLENDFQSYRPRYDYTIYSDYLYFQFISTGITSSLLRSLLVSALFIVCIIFLLTLSLGKTLISIVVNTIPLGFMIFILVIFGVDMNITTSLSLVICLGLIVDDTIQILYRRVRLREPLGELGFGVLTTSILVTSGFLTFLISSSRPNQIFGIICAVVFIIAAISDMTVMPWLLRDKKVAENYDIEKQSL
jgi:uncharacterized protein